MSQPFNQTSPCRRRHRAIELLQRLALASSIFLASTGIQAQTTNFYGEQAINPHIQPNVLNGGRVHFNYYGSGDANGDGVIDYQDYIAMQNNLSNDRTDINGDGITNSSDLAILNSFLNGQIKYLPAHWDLLQDSTERKSWLQKALAIDSTSNIPPSSIWTCNNYSHQTVINLSGIENISGSGFNFGPNYGQHDSTKNARFNIPIYYVSTKANDINNTSHAINAVLIGDSATNFSDWYFLEPQLDSRVHPGNFSMSPNSYAYLQRSAYGYNSLVQQFMYGNQQGPVKFNLTNGNDSLIWTNPYAVLTRTPVPLEPTNEIIPNDTLIQLGNPTDTSATGYVSNISNGAHVNHTDSIDSINVDNYDIYRTFSWKPFHKYIDSSAPTTVLYEYPWTWLNVDSLGTQKIEVRDTQPPTITGISGTHQVPFGSPIPQPQINYTDNSGLPVTINLSDSITQSTNPDSCSYFNYEQWIKAELSDISGNKTDTIFKNADVYKPNTSLVFLEVPVDTLVDKSFQLTQANLDGFVEVIDTIYTTNPITLSHDTTLTWSSLFEMRYDIYTTVTGSCGCTRDTTWRLVKWLGYSIEDISNTAAFFTLYPVPASEVIHITLESDHLLEGQWKIINMEGRKLVEGEFPPGQYTCPVNISDITPGVYVMEVSVSRKILRKKFTKTW